MPSDLQLKDLRAAAQALKLKLEEIEAEADAKGLESAFQTARQKKVDAIMTTTTRPFFAERKRIVELAGKYRLPAIDFQKEFVGEVGLPRDWSILFLVHSRTTPVNLRSRISDAGSRLHDRTL